MPQLDPSSYSSQLFWLMICFVLLYVLMARITLPRVQGVLGKRADTIGGDIEQARRMKADGEMAREHYEKALLHARQRCQAMLTETQVEITARAHARQGELDRVIEHKIAESQTSIAAATKDVRGKLASVASEITMSIAKAVGNYSPDSGKVNDAVGEAIKKQGA